MLHTFSLVLICVAGLSSALYDSHSEVVELTPTNFDRLVVDSDEVWIVEFYAPWCGHCKNLVPAYNKAAKALKGIAKVGALNADEHKGFSKQYGVSGFPSIKIFTGSKHIPYKGARTADALVDAALKAIKEKAYLRLGKSTHSDDTSDKPETYGHDIPWRQITRNTTHLSPLPQKKVQKETDQLETCQPQSFISDTIQTQATTASYIQRQTTQNISTMSQTTQNIISMSKTMYKPSTMSILEQVKLLQNHLFRGDISGADKPRIIKALMKLKSVLHGRQALNASIIKRRLAQRHRL